MVVCYYALTKYLLIPVSDAMTWQNLTCNRVENLHECLVPMRSLKFVLSNYAYPWILLAENLKTT